MRAPPKEERPGYLVAFLRMDPNAASLRTRRFLFFVSTMITLYRLRSLSFFAKAFVCDPMEPSARAFRCAIMRHQRGRISGFG